MNDKSFAPTAVPYVYLDIDLIEKPISNAAFRLLMFFDLITGTGKTWGDAETFVNTYVLNQEPGKTFEALVEELRANDLFDDGNWDWGDE